MRIAFKTPETHLYTALTNLCVNYIVKNMEYISWYFWVFCIQDLAPPSSLSIIILNECLISPINTDHSHNSTLDLHSNKVRGRLQIIELITT
jgi:hypothetical protein